MANFDGETPKDRARHFLRAGLAKCHTRLDSLSENALKVTPQILQDGLRNILPLIGESLFKAAAVFLPDANETPDLDFYFWPGYVSSLDRSVATRLTMECELNAKESIPCGIGYTLEGNAEVTDHEWPYYQLCDTAVWYSRLLVKEDAHSNGEIFVPGGTHGWVLQSRELPKLGRDDSSLDVLAIQLKRDYIPPLTRQAGWFDIHLDHSSQSEWGNTIADCLNDSEQIKQREEYEWPYPLRASGTHDATTGEIRKRLYSLWLSACFDREWWNNTLVWRSRFADELEHQRDLKNLSGRVRHAPEIPTTWSQHDYNCWYTLVLDQVTGLNVVEGQVPELGSAMILTSRPLDRDYLFLAKQWVESIYLQMRYLENVVRLNENVVRLNQKLDVFLNAEERLRRFEDLLWPETTEGWFHDDNPNVPHNCPTDLTRLASCKAAVKHYLTNLFDPAVPPESWFTDEQFKWLFLDLAHLVGVTSIAQQSNVVVSHVARNLTLGNVVLLLAASMKEMAQTKLNTITWDKHKSCVQILSHRQTRDEARKAILTLGHELFSLLVTHDKDKHSPLLIYLGLTPKMLQIKLNFDPWNQSDEKPKRKPLMNKVRDLDSGDDGGVYKAYRQFLLSSATTQNGREARCVVNLLVYPSEPTVCSLEICPCH